MNDSNANVLCGTPVLAPHTVALTFDDGPGPRTAELARYLRDEEVPATFFVLGESIERYGEVLDTIRDCGHQIGLHSEWHRPFTSITYRQGQTVDGCVAVIEETLVGNDGGVALLHDFAPYTEFTAGGLTEAELDLRVVEIATLLIQRLRGHGFTFVGL